MPRGRTEHLNEVEDHGRASVQPTLSHRPGGGGRHRHPEAHDPGSGPVWCVPEENSSLWATFAGVKDVSNTNGRTEAYVPTRAQSAWPVCTSWASLARAEWGAFDLSGGLGGSGRGGLASGVAGSDLSDVPRSIIGR